MPGDAADARVDEPGAKGDEGETMTAQASTSESEESLDDKIARLKRELSAAETEAELTRADEEMCDAAGYFLCVSSGDADPGEARQPYSADEIRYAIELLKRARGGFEAWVDAKRAGRTSGPLALSPVDDELPRDDALIDDPYGGGEIVKVRKGWQYRVTSCGMEVRSKPQPTEEDARRVLANFWATQKRIDEQARARTKPPHLLPAHEPTAIVAEVPEVVAAATSVARVAWSPNWPSRVAEEPPMNDQERTPALCGNCRKPGHYRRTCPERDPLGNGYKNQPRTKEIHPATVAGSEVATDGPTAAEEPDPEDSEEGEPGPQVSLRSDAEVAALVKQYVPLAHKVARKFSAYALTLEAIGYDDVFAAAQEGILLAARSWDPSKGASFLTHGFNHARWGVHRLLRTMELVESGKAKRWVAQGFEMPNLVSMSTPVRRNDPEGRTMEDVLSATLVGDDPGADAMEMSDLVERIEEATKVLRPRDREIFLKHFREERTLDDTGGEFELSRERVRQILMASVDKLRLYMARDSQDGWSAKDQQGRRTCLVCNGAGEERPGVDCANCDGDGYRWRDEPLTPLPYSTRFPPTTIQFTKLPETTRKFPPPRAPTNPDYIHPGRGWGSVDDDGVSKHDLCKGTGAVRFQDGKGKTTERKCFPCEGVGWKQCLRKPSEEAVAS